MLCSVIKIGGSAYVVWVSSTLIIFGSHTCLHHDLGHRMPPSCQCPMSALDSSCCWNYSVSQLRWVIVTHL